MPVMAIKKFQAGMKMKNFPIVKPVLQCMGEVRYVATLSPMKPARKYTAM